MKIPSIKAIFTDLLFIGGIILLVVGFAKGASTVARLAIFEQYPLDVYEERACDFPLTVDGEIMPRETKEDCLMSLELARKVKLTDDIVNSVTLFATGVILTLAFRHYLLGNSRLIKIFSSLRGPRRHK